MADRIEFSVDNVPGFAEAARLAPRRILASVKREFQREGNKFQTAYRKTYLFGPPGINLPKRQATLTKTGRRQLKKRTNRDAKGVQQAHVIAKAIAGAKGLVLVGYLSRFLGYHRAKLEGPFRALFRAILPTLRGRVEREAARITQAVLDKGLRDAKRGRR